MDTNVAFPVVLQFTGKPQPAGSKRSFVPKGKDGQPYRNKDGRIIVNTVDDNKHAKGWKEYVRLSAEEQYEGPLLAGPLVVEMVFIVARAKGHYGTGRNEGLLKDSAPAVPVVRPDVLKLARGVEDALTGVVWRDDSLIVDERIGKRYGERPGCEVRIWLHEAEKVADLVALGRIEPPRPEERWDQLSLAEVA